MTTACGVIVQWLITWALFVSRCLTSQIDIINTSSTCVISSVTLNVQFLSKLGEGNVFSFGCKAILCPPPPTYPHGHMETYHSATFPPRTCLNLLNFDSPLKGLLITARKRRLGQGSGFTLCLSLCVSQWG